MSLRTKNIIYTLVLLSAMFMVWKYREGKQETLVAFEGRTMGTTYHIQYFDKQGRNLKPQVDSLLIVFNQSLSTYIPDAEISQFNLSASFQFQLPYFYPVIASSKEIFEITDGYFDPTVMPLVNAWGFGPAKPSPPNAKQVDSLMSFVGFDKIFFNQDSVWKTDKRVQLDFSAIAKGYGADIVADYIQSKGIENLFVEIGGEVVAKGKNLARNRVWEIGILDPDSEPIHQRYKLFVSLDNKAIATSGNYYNYREVDGVKYSHTINPLTGYPVQHAILSASVFADDCMTADALATAFMAMGHEKAKEILHENKQWDAILIYSSPEGDLVVYATEGIRAFTSISE
ncbi:MAG TPA: FAD:protein FMN transferase [Cyclobacteriaceae bacterium]|nr:FAD:protein FMN transferase [Cyclobacteriaceae bacterium]